MTWTFTDIFSKRFWRNNVEPIKNAVSEQGVAQESSFLPRSSSSSYFSLLPHVERLEKEKGVLLTTYFYEEPL